MKSKLKQELKDFLRLAKILILMVLFSWLLQNFIWLAMTGHLANA